MIDGRLAKQWRGGHMAVGCWLTVPDGPEYWLQQFFGMVPPSSSGGAALYSPVCKYAVVQRLLQFLVGFADSLSN
jgi:hypothetical protein